MSGLVQRHGRAAGAMTGRLLCGSSLAALVFLALPAVAHAQDRHWDPNDTSVGNGGDGTWDTSGNVWSPSGDGVSGPYTPWDNGALDNAIFEGAAGTVTLAEPITVHNITFNAPGYVLTGDTLTLAGADPTISVIGSTREAVIDSVIAGNAGLTKDSAGTLTLNGANTFTGDVVVNAGALVVNDGAALGDAANGLTLADGTAFTSAGSLAGRTITLLGGQATLRGAGVGAAHFTGAGGIRAAGSITLDDDTNDYTGATTLTGGGNLYFSSIGDIGEASALGAAADAASGTITLGVGTYASAYARYTGAGDSSNRDWQLGSHFYQTSSIVNEGTGTLTLTGDIVSAHIASSIGVRNIILDAATADLELLGTISSNNNGVGVVFTGGGTGRTITVAGANTFGGDALIQNVTVNVGSLKDTGVASGLGTGETGDIGIVNGMLSYTGGGDSSDRALSVSGNATIANDGTGALALSGESVFVAGGAVDTLTLGGGYAGTNTFSGVISGAGNLHSDGAGTWVVSGANTFVGDVIVDSGTLRAGGTDAFGASSGLVVNGGTLDLGGFDLTARKLEGAGGEVALGANTLTIDTAASAAYAGNISGSGSLHKTGIGTLTLSGVNSYTGATSITGGTLGLVFSDAGAPSANIISSASTLNLSGGSLSIVGADGTDNSQSFNGLNVVAGSNRISATSGAGGSVDVNFGAITRTGGLVDFVLPGSGSFTTSSASLGGWATVNGSDYAKVVGGFITAFDATDYVIKDDASTWLTGEVVSDAGGAANTPFFNTVTGSIQLGGLKYTAAANSTVGIGSGETLGIDGTIIVAASVGAASQTISGGSLTGGAGGTLGVLQNGTGRFTIGSTIVNNGGATGFTKGGDGIVRLTGANTYTGATILSGGTLEITTLANAGQASSIGAASTDSSNLVLEAGMLHFDGAGDAITNRGFTLVNGGADAPRIGVDAGHSVEFSGLVTSPDDAGLTKVGWGELVLSYAENDYIGVTTIRGGGAGNYSTLSVNTLADGGSVSGIGAASSDSANLVLNTGGRLRYTGGTVAIDRGFTLESGGRIDVAQAGTTLTIDGTAVGTGGLVKDGAGTLVLTGTNTYTGGTIVNAGTLRAGSIAAFGPDTSPMGVNAGATFDLGGLDIKVGALNNGAGGGGDVLLGSTTLSIGGANGSFTGTISGTGGLTKTPGTTQVLSGGHNSYTGVTTFDGGTLSVGVLADGGVVSDIGASGSDAANMVFTGGRLTYTGGTTSIDRGFTLLSGDGYIDVSNAATTLEFEGEAVGAGRLRKEGAGTLVLSGSNNLTGSMLIDGGILRAGSNDALGTAGLTLANAAGAALDLDGYDNTIGYLNGGGSSGGNILLGGATLTLNWASGTAAYAGTISGTGGLIKNGSVNQALSGCASDYAGATVINGGILTVSCLADGGANSSIGASSADAANLVINGATLRYTGAGGSTDRRFTLGASGNNALDASGTGAIAFTSDAALTFSGADTAQTLTLTGTNTGDNILAAELTNNGTGETSLTKEGSGTWILTNQASTYTGVTRIDGGVLGVDKLADGGLASSLGASSADASNLIIGNGSTLRYTGAGDTTNRLFTLSAGTTFIESSGTGAIVFTDTGPVTLADENLDRTIALGGSNTGNNTLAGSIGDAGTGVTILAKNDAGTWVLAGDNSYTGNTVINDGTLVLGNGGTTGSIVSDTINLGTLAFNRADGYTYDGVISNVGAVRQIGAGTTILTGDNTYTGGTTITAGTLQLGDGGTTGSIVGDVANDGLLAFDRSDSYEFAGLISGAGALAQNGTGTTILSADNSYTGGTTITAGTLQIGDGGTSGSIVGNVVNDGALAFNRSDVFTYAGQVSGTGSLTKDGAGTLVLTGASSYIGGTTISSGTLQIGNGGTSGSIVGDVTDNGTLVFDRSDAIGFGGLISGSGDLVKNGAGVLTLTADNSYSGATTINAGTLIVNGDQSAATGLTQVSTGAALGGIGTIGGDVTIADGGILAPGSGGAGTLGIAGSLSLSNGSTLNYEFGEADVAGGALNDLVTVGGNLTLDGTLNVTETAGGSFGAGIYRVFTYEGALIDNGLTLGTMPAGSDLTVQTAIGGQVNLVNAAGLQLTLWDGDAGPKFDGNVNGGDGFWQSGAGNDNWTNTDGTINAAYADGAFAIFTGAAGTVAVDNSLGPVTASGMQFASDGYLVGGGDIALVGPQSTIRVGDGTTAGAAMTATIASRLIGASQLVKTDDGTLVLTGANGYTGGTEIDGGTLQLGDGGIAGSISGDVVNNGTLVFNRSDAVTFAGAISGTGAVSQIGTGTTVLTNVNGYTGNTVVQGGTLELSSGGTIGNSALTTIGGAAVLSVADATSSLTTQALAVGVQSGDAATLTIGNGGTVDVTGTSPILVGNFGNGTITVDGVGSALTTGGDLEIGQSGSSIGTVNVTNGGTVSANETSIGMDGAQGIVLVSGAGSAWTNTGTLRIGNYTGTGSLRIDDQATASNLNAEIGSSGQGDVVVAGLGTSWTSHGQLTVGSYDVGTLRIEGGATVTSNQGYIGSGDTGNGAVVVTGPGSSWATTLNINVGNYGTGSLTIDDGALVQAALGVDLGASAADADGTLTVQGTAASRGILETSQIRGGLGAAHFTIDGGIVRASADNADFVYGFGAQAIAIGTNGATIDTNGHDIGVAARFTGAGDLVKTGAGALVLGGANDYLGTTSVNDGALLVNGDQSAVTGLTSVAAATLGGTGIIGGDVTVAGGVIDPGDLGDAPGTLTINGGLTLDGGSVLDYNFGQAGVVGGAFNDLIDVGGDLTLDGTLNVATAAGGSFDPGLYRVINYGGALTDNGLTIGAIPSSDFYVQTSVAGQVNLVNTAGMTLRFWDGDTLAAKNSGTIEGGDGLWQGTSGNDNWTDQTGAANAPFTDGAFAVFMGASGTVTVDDGTGPVNASGMQFLTDGYVIEGDAINLTDAPGSAIRVGDGTAAGAGIAATVASTLTGATQLVKTDLGTLILSGTNSYTGGTAIDGGTLQIAADTNLGDASGGLSFNGGTLHTTANILSGRAVELAGLGTFLTDTDTTLTLNGAISGAGSLTKIGAGTLALHGVSAFDGDMAVNGGTAFISDGGSVSDYRGYIGTGTGQTGTVIVSGSNASWINDSHLYVGYDGSGTLEIRDGADVSNAAVFIGLNGDAAGSVIVSGAGSTWTNSQNLYVGDNGDGTLIIEAGGVASASGPFALGVGVGSTGSATITGTDSKVTTISGLFVGNSGEAELTIADGGAVSGLYAEIGYFDGSSGTINIGAAAGDGPVSAGTLDTPTLTFRDGDGTLVFNHTDTDYVFSTAVQSDGAGTHSISHLAGTTLLTGDSSGFAGATTVSGGTLLVGDASGAGSLGGTVDVTSGGTLGGSGTIGGNVTIGDGATLAPGNSPGTLTIGGALTLDAGSMLDFEFGEAGVAGGALNDLVTVGGDLTLDGTIDVSVSAGGSFGPGVYRVFSYGGTLTDNGLALGSMPGGSSVAVQTAVAGQVNLVNTGGLTLNFWDGAAGPQNDDVVQGGDGVWRVGGGTNAWTDANGSVNADYAQGGFAVFSAGSGAVTIDNSGGGVLASGMQFASDGYRLTGDALTLTGTDAIIQVGDGSAASAGYTAAIDAELAGTARLVKTDAGTLILAADNSYTGGTTIDGGTLQIGNGGASGSVIGDIVDNGALVVNRSDTLTLDGTISGSGSLMQRGGTLVLTGANSYAGGTLVAGGTIQISSDANLGDVAGALSLQGGTLQAGASFASSRDILVGSTASNNIDTQGFDVTLGGVIGDGPSNAAGNFLNKLGAGTLTLTGANSYSNRTVIAGGTLALAAAGTIGAGNLVVGSGTVFDISQADIGARVVQLGGAADGTIALGAKTLTLGLDHSYTDWSGTIVDGGIGGGVGGRVVITASYGAVRFYNANSYTGGTTVAAGTFALAGNGSLDAGGAVAVNAGATFDIAGLTGAGTTIGDLSGVGAIALGAKALTFGTGNDTAFAGTVTGDDGALVKAGAGTFTFTGDGSYTGGTTIAAGTLRLGDGGTSGAIAGDVIDNGTLAFDRSDAVTFAGAISGSGAVTQSGAGTTILTGTNSYAGETTVAAGTLLVNGDQSGATGLTSVASGATLGGGGTIGGDVAIADGGILAPGDSPGTLTINGDLALSAGATLAFELGQANVPGGPLNDLVDVGGDLTLDGTVDVTEAAGGSFGPGVYRLLDYAGTLTDNGLAVGSLPGGDAFVQTAIAHQVNLVNTAGLTLNFWDGAAGPKNDGTIQGGDGVWRLGGGDNDWTGFDGLVNADYAQGSFAIFQGAGGAVTVDDSAGDVRAAGLQFTSDGYTIAGDALTLTGSQAFIHVGDGGAGDAGVTATIDAVLTGPAGLVKDMGGTLVLTGANTYTGGTAINGGTLRIASDANLGDATGALTLDGGTLNTTADIVTSRAVALSGNGTLRTDAGTRLALDGLVSGAGALTKDGAGRLVLTADESYAGGTTIAAGTLQIGNGGGTGSIVGAIANNGTLALDRTGTLTLDSAISGTGGLDQIGGGTTVLSGANSYAGATNVAAGTLLVNGDQSGATGLTAVATGAALGGVGTIGGDVTLADGATLTPGAGGAGALTINGSLTLASGAQIDMDFGAANAVGDPRNDVVNIGGDLTLDGTLNVAVASGGAFDIGLYRVANYAGALTDNGLALGTLPAGADVFVQTSVANQVNLINRGGATLNFWDGAAGPKFDGAVNGGDGIWQASAGNDNWADASGAVNAGYDDGAFAIFSGAAGTVTIDNGLGAVVASGLQFAGDGYTIAGEGLTLTGPQSVIRVGDGSAAGAGYTATIASVVSGDTSLVKTDAGVLVLTAANGYTGGTAINGGTIRISDDANLGAAAGGVTLDGGTLETTADLGSARAIDLAGNGTLLTDVGTTLTLDGALSGAGNLVKDGTGTLVLAGVGTNSGGIAVNAGTLLVDGDFAGATGATAVATGATLGGVGAIGGDVTIADGATLTPGSGGAGALTINGDLALASGSRLAFEFGQANSAGGALNDLVEVGGDLTLDGTLDVAVTAGGTFGAGVYRVFNYGGALTDNGLTLGTLPGGANATVQTAIAGQVNLVNSAGLALNFWDGAAGPKFDGVVNGGDGIWQHGGADNWTDADGLVNAAYADGGFAVFGGTGGTVTVDAGNGAVTSGGMQFAADGYAITGDALTLTDATTTIRVGDGSTAGEAYVATIEAALTGDSQLVKTDAGTLILGGANSYTGGTAINGGTVQIAADANLGDAAGDVTLDGGTLATAADLSSARGVTLAGDGAIATAGDTTFTFDGSLSGTGALTKQGAGTLLLTGDNGGYTAATTVAAGTLAVDGELGGAVAIDAGARLAGSGRVGDVANNGVIAPGRDGFGTLTVGAYAGKGGVIEIETALGGDASETDRLVVTGGTSGATEITVANRGGLGAQTVEGIKLIDVTGGASDGTFALRGDYVFEGDQAVIAGAYGYRLYQGGVSTPNDGDWYLRSALLEAPEEPQEPLYQPGVPIYENYAQTLQTLGGLPTLQQRVGNRRWAPSASGAGNGIWGRMESRRFRPEARASTTASDLNVDSWRLQAGLDRTLSQGDGGQLVAGVTAHYGKANGAVRSIFGNGGIHVEGYGVGATLTWYAPGGFYADGQAQFTWFDTRLASSVLGTLADGNDGKGRAVSLEVGKRSAVGGGLTLTPQIQMSYQNVDFDAFDDPSDARVSSRNGDSLKTRWGISIDHDQAWDANGSSRRTHLYGLFNLSYEWLDGTRVDVSGTPIHTGNDRLWVEAALGGSLGLGDRLTIYTQVSASSALRAFGDSYSVKGTAGVRLAF